MPKREAAFTVVEIIIAALLVTVVISGVTLALAGGSKLETKRDIKSRMVAATERVYEHVRSDKGWIESCRRANVTSAPKTCDLTAVIDADLLEDDIFGDTFAFKATATATGVDSDGDGTILADSDGNADDFFQLNISIAVPGGDAERLGSPPVRTVESIVNGSTNNDSGSLVVAFCSADNQIDERVQISGCETGGTYWTEMPTCADDSACMPWALGTLKGIPGLLTQPTRMLGVRPVTGVSFQLTRIADGESFDGPSTVNSSLAVTTAQDSSLGPGVYKFPDLPVGSWRVVTPATYPGGRVDWPTHHVPSTKQATVERNRTARALVMLQDPAAAPSYTMTFSRAIHERRFTGASQRLRNDIIPECEAPASYYAGAFVVETKTCDNPTGHFVATSKLGHQGVSTGEARFYNVYESWGQYQDYVDVYYFAKVNSESEWDGAADAAEFAAQPAPRGRVTLRVDSGGSPTYSTPSWSTGSIPEAPNRPRNSGGGSGAWNTVGTKASITGLPAGLHTPPTLQAASKINNVEVAYGPSGCEQRYLWVRADTNGFGTCSTAHMKGDDGECYTHLNGGDGIANYTWATGCGPLEWNGKLITAPTNQFLIYKICGHRQSWVKQANETWFGQYKFEWILTPEQNAKLASGEVVYDDPTYRAWLAAAEAAYRAIYAGFGYTLLPGAPHRLGGDKHWYKHLVYGTSTTTSSSPCKDMSANPLDCPSLDRWDNCNRTETVVITATPGWDVGGGNNDGNKFPTSGSSLKSMSP